MEGQFLVAMEGGSPWGLTLQGGVDFRSPLRVGRVSFLSQLRAFSCVMFSLQAFFKYHEEHTLISV